MLVQRIRRHMANDFPSAEFSTTENEVLLYIDQALAATLVGQVYAGAKVEGNLAVPEGWLTTYSLSTVSQDITTGEWYCTLPQPPVSLPLGYSISRVYTVLSGNGVSEDFLPIKAKRTSFRNFMPKPKGGSYRVIGNKIYLELSDGASLLNYPIYTVMAKTRTESLTETLNLPDDAIDAIFNNVVLKLKDRLQVPQDVIADDLPSGNKAS